MNSLHHPPAQAQRSRSDALVLAYKSLRDEYITAWSSGSQAMVRTPGFTRKHKQMMLADVITDCLCGTASDELWHEIIGILGGLASGGDQDVLRMRSMALIARMAKDHAAYHAEDAVNDMEESNEFE